MRNSERLSQLLQRLDAVIVSIDAHGWAKRSFAPIVLTLAVISLVTACPDYAHFGPYPGVPWAAEAVAWKFNHPFALIPVAEVSHRAGASDGGIIEQLGKRSYRIAIPAAANTLGIGITTTLVVQQAAAVVFLGIFVLVAREALGDATSALFAGLMAATSFVGQWGFNDFTNFDGFAYLTLLLILWMRSAVCVALLTLFGGFCDERVILAIPLVWLWHAARPARQELQRPQPLETRENPGAFQFARAHWGLLAGFLGFGVLRLLLGFHWHQMVDTSGMRFAVMKSNLLWLPLALFGGIKGGALLFFGAGLLMVTLGGESYLALVGFATAPCVIAALWVYDLTRSLTFAFPSYFLAMCVLRRHMSRIEIRRLTFCAAFGCAIFPTYWVLLRVYCLLPVLRWL